VPLSAALNNLSKAGASIKIFPNPFSSVTTFELICDKPSQAYICVLDASGKKVSELLNDSFNSGIRIYTWDGKSDNGQNLVNGIYFVQIQINGYTETQKVILNR
jgi:flagellar hook assembly protein FlgD